MKIQHCRWRLGGVGLAAGDLNTHNIFRARYGEKDSTIKVIMRSEYLRQVILFFLFTITFICCIAHSHNSVQCVTFHQSVTHFFFASTATCYFVYQIQYISLGVSVSTVWSRQIHLHRFFSWPSPLIAINNNFSLCSSESSIHLCFILYETAIVVLISDVMNDVRIYARKQDKANTYRAT